MLTNHKLVLPLFIFWASLAFPAFANDIQVLATVDRNQITLEDSLELSITIKGTQNTPPPELPSIPDFRITSSGNSSSTQIINMERSVSITHNYRLTPMNAGKFKSGPRASEQTTKSIQLNPLTLWFKKQCLQASLEIDLCF